MSAARKVVESTVRRFFGHVTEILLSIILLIVVCLPLAFALPMWIQNVAFGVPFSDLAINPVTWFGISGAVSLILLLAAASLVLGYLDVSRMTPKPEVAAAGKEAVAEEEETEKEEPEIEAETVGEDTGEADDAEAFSHESVEGDTNTSESED